MQQLRWELRDDSSAQAEALTGAAFEVGVVTVEFGPGGDGTGLPWSAVEPWTRSRAVTLAIVDGLVASPALDFALCSDLVYVRSTARLRLAAGPGPPSPGVIWALGRAGRRALGRGLLSTADLEPVEAVELGIAHLVLADGESAPLPEGASINAATTVRDLMRSKVPGNAGLVLELASFRLLFAQGDPGEGAEAFLDKREPTFDLPKRSILR